MKKKKKVLRKIILCLVLIILISLSVNTVIFLQSPYLSRRLYRGSVGHFKNNNALKFNMALHLINVTLPDVNNDKKNEFENYECYYYSNRYNPFTMTFRPRALRRYSLIELIYSDNQIDDPYAISNKYYCNYVQIFADDFLNKYYNKPFVNIKNTTTPCEIGCEKELDVFNEEHEKHIYYQIKGEILYHNDRYIVTIYSTDPIYDTELFNNEFDRILASIN